MPQRRFRTFGPQPKKRSISRRSLLVGGGAGVGLLVAWTFWPRDYGFNLVAGKSEHILNGFVKVGEDGHVTVVVPQIEMGQGAFTLIAQIIADELGADWRTIAIEPAPLNPNYANPVVVADWNNGVASRLLGDTGQWVENKLAPDDAFQVTGNSSSVRAFEAAARNAGAAARALLCLAAAKRWNADWQACDTLDGFVFRGNDRLRFADLAAEAAKLEVPPALNFRTGVEGRLRGQTLQRLDYPSKVDGSANFAADIRLPEMVFAAIRMGPLGNARLVEANREALAKQPGVIGVVVQEKWVAAVATNSWLADQALAKVAPRFGLAEPVADTGKASGALDAAFSESPTRWLQRGEADAALGIGRVIKAEYSAGLAPHLALEPMAATGVVRNGQLEIWLPTQVPGLARKAAADALGWAIDHVTVYPMIVGGSFGRKYETEIAGQVAIIANEIKKPVQLLWSREQDMAQDRFRPMARARLAARVEGPAIKAWKASIAAPASVLEMLSRIREGNGPADALADVAASFEQAAMSGAAPPYQIDQLGIDHHAVSLGIPTGKWRSGADSYTAFFNECFIDELSKEAGVDPFTFRMGMLGGNKRLATCLTKVTALGSWQGGGQGTRQGIACHSMLGSHVAVLAEAQIDDRQRIRVSKLYAVADLGRLTNGEIARQQIEGGLLFGMAAAIGNAIQVKKGVVSPRTLGSLGLPQLADMPEMFVELIPSTEAFGGVGEVAVPPVAPAIANAIFAGGGRRLRSLPLLPWS